MTLLRRKIASERLSNMEDKANAKVKFYISEEQQRALALNNDEVSEEARLNKGDAAPPLAKHDKLLMMTGSTRESKVKLYVDNAVKK